MYLIIIYPTLLKCDIYLNELKGNDINYTL